MPRKSRKTRLPIGAELRKARLRAGLSQEELGFAADVDRTFISRLENDHYPASLDLLYVLCQQLGIKTSQLIARAEKDMVRKKK